MNRLTTNPYSHLGTRQKAVLRFLTDIDRQHPGAWTIVATIPDDNGHPLTTAHLVATNLHERGLVYTSTAILNHKCRALVRIKPTNLEHLFSRSIELANQMWHARDQLNEVLAAMGNQQADITYHKATISIDDAPSLIIDHQTDTHHHQMVTHTD